MTVCMKCCLNHVSPEVESPIEMEMGVQTNFTIGKGGIFIERKEYEAPSLKQASKDLDEISLSSTVVMSMEPDGDHSDSSQHSEKVPEKNQISEVDEIDPSIRNLIKVDIKNNPLQVLQILSSNVGVPELTRSRHIFSGESEMTLQDAIGMAQKRDPRIKRTTLFEDTSEFLLCNIRAKFGYEEMILSRDPVRTFHCIYDHSVWMAFYIGKYHSVFIDDGRNFPGFIVKRVDFRVQQVKKKTLKEETEDEFTNIADLNTFDV